MVCKKRKEKKSKCFVKCRIIEAKNSVLCENRIAIHQITINFLVPSL